MTHLNYLVLFFSSLYHTYRDSISFHLALVLVCSIWLIVFVFWLVQVFIDGHVVKIWTSNLATVFFYVLPAALSMRSTSALRSHSSLIASFELVSISVYYVSNNY